MASEVLIERGFLRLPTGRVHYRFVEPPATSGRPPLYMAHAGPGCSRGLEPLIADLGLDRQVIAPDMLGNGDSDPPEVRETDIGYYVDGVLQVMDRLKLAQVDFYGDHTGAQIGCQLAVSHPERVRRLVLDGAPLFPPELKAELLARYAPAITPDDFGGHLIRVWSFVRELSVHFPHYMTDPAHRLTASAIPAPEVRHLLVVDMLKALPTYHLAYRAAFSHDTAGWLARLKLPTLLMAASADPLAAYLDEAGALAPHARIAKVAREDKAATVRAFLDAAEVTPSHAGQKAL